MTKQITITANNQVNTGVDQFTTGLTTYLKELGLPSEQVLMPIPERTKVINNLPDVISLIDPQQRLSSIYLSKFIAACGAGLFDAALNFIWDETVLSLRDKIIRFDLEYFYDSVITDEKKRVRLKDENDLVKLDEWELVRGCHLTGILSDIGYKHLDYIRDMRNWASAAHPNQNDLTGLQLISWLETCIKEVIGKEPEASAIEVKRVLESIRNNILTTLDAQHINAALEHLPADIVKSLLRTLFGMYTTPTASQQLKNNIKMISEKAWDMASEEAKYECGLRYGSFAANGETDKKQAAHEFLTTVKGLSFLPTDTLALEISGKIDNLYNAHIAFNNFHNEPSHAKALSSYIPSNGSIPNAIRKPFVRTLVLCKIGNGYGVSDMALPYYDEMISKFGEPELKELVTILTEREFSSRLSLGNCSQRYRAIIDQFIGKTTNQITKQAMQMIMDASIPQLPHLGKDSRFTALTTNYYKTP